MDFNLMFEGCIYPHWKKCGNQKCKCQVSRKNWHGPYWVIAVTRDTKPQVIYLRKDQVDFFKRGVEAAKNYNDILRHSITVTKAIDVMFRKIAYYRRAVPFRRGKDLAVKYQGRLSDAFIQSTMPEAWKFKSKALNWSPTPTDPAARLNEKFLIRKKKIGKGRSPLVFLKASVQSFSAPGDRAAHPPAIAG